MRQITSMQVDLLQEIGSIGTGHATTGIAKLLGNRVEMNVAQAKRLPLEDVALFLGGAEQLVHGVCFKINGDITGTMLMVMPGDTAEQLLHLWLGEEHPSLNEMTDYEDSALKELSNIAIGGYLISLSQLTGLTIFCSIPSLAFDMLGALLNEALADVASQADEVILINTEFKIHKDTINGYFFLILDAQSMETLFSTLRVD